ncbi:type 11 methyltransferase [Sphingopyxis sp. MC1]|nr:type 11 methyltransferase [Sphingopyxis sp. MC1]
MKPTLSTSRRLRRRHSASSATPNRIAAVTLTDSIDTCIDAQPFANRGSFPPVTRCRYAFASDYCNRSSCRHRSGVRDGRSARRTWRSWRARCRARGRDRRSGGGADPHARQCRARRGAPSHRNAGLLRREAGRYGRRAVAGRRLVYRDSGAADPKRWRHALCRGTVGARAEHDPQMAGGQARRLWRGQACRISRDRRRTQGARRQRRRGADLSQRPQLALRRHGQDRRSLPANLCDAEARRRAGRRRPPPARGDGFGARGKERLYEALVDRRLCRSRRIQAGGRKRGQRQPPGHARL